MGKRTNVFLDAAAFGGGTILGISVISFIQSLLGLVIGYYIYQHAVRLEKENPDSSTAGLLKLIGILFMFGPFIAASVFLNEE
tara:strand:- start:1071 stop:1319 length:249 start_codon:yes stop_codon:yes gene_type:complete